MKVGDLSPELVVALQEIAEQVCDERRLNCKHILKNACLFEITKEMCYLDYPERGTKHFSIIVRCYLFEVILSSVVVDGVPKNTTSWVIRFHPGSEVNPSGLLPVDDLEQKIRELEDTSLPDRARSDLYSQLNQAWTKEVENLEKGSIIKSLV